MIGKLIVLGVSLSTLGALASERPSCRDYCHGTTLYTNGYVQCFGSDCICNYNLVLQSPKCPEVEPEWVKQPATNKADRGG